jgi:hypothetical protein
MVKNVRGMARLGVLAVGLGIGAAWAHMPLASADTSSDWLSSIDGLLSGASPAPATPIDLFISFDGYTIYDGGGTAEAFTTTGDYSLAIADGAGAYADAEGGTGDSAYADGAGAEAFADGGTGDYALASGTDANAEAGSLASGATGNNFDTAVDIGNNGSGDVADNVGAYAGNGSLYEVGGFQGTDVGTDSNDTAYDFGNNSAGTSDNGAFAGYYGGVSGNGDTAYDVGNNSGSNFDGAFAVGGNDNYASDSGNNTAGFDYAFASDGNNNTAIADTSDSIISKDVDAYGGNGNYAYVDGPANSTATADGGGDVAYVSDPFGAAGSPDSAVAGNGFSNDLAEVLFAHGNATADSANLLYDIVSLFGNSAGSL